MTAVAPMVWGTTYLTTTELLPQDRPLLTAALRALPAGLVLLLVTRRLPRGDWWWRAAVLGSLNIGVFFPLLFLGAYRLPGGVAATAGAIQPLIVMAFAARLNAEALSNRRVLAALAGIAGVALLVLRAGARLDTLGLAAATGATVVMAFGVVLTKRWGQPAPLLAVTGWQLTAGGLLLAPLALIFEDLPAGGLTLNNTLGYLYLGAFGTALAYALWFRGIKALPSASVTFLGLLAPLVATLLGWIVLGQGLTPGQLLGAAMVLGAVLTVQLTPATGRPVPTIRRELQTLSR
jgi:probable blue pigment (indigoidine) exporter